MTLTFTLVQKTAKILGMSAIRRRSLYEALPIYQYSKLIKARYPHFENVIETNLNTFGAMAVFGDFSLLAFLQPNALEHKRLSLDEHRKIEAFFSSLVGRYGPALSRENFLDVMLPGFRAYKKVYTSLETKYQDFPKMRFFDIGTLFQNVEESTYVDVIHYTKVGNRLIAERMSEDILAILEGIVTKVTSRVM